MHPLPPCTAAITTTATSLPLTSSTCLLCAAGVLHDRSSTLLLRHHRLPAVASLQYLHQALGLEHGQLRSEVAALRDEVGSMCVAFVVCEGR